MTRLELVAFAILAFGLIGYVLCLILLWRFRTWMGGRGSGWPRILLSTLIWLVVLLGLLYLNSLIATLDLIPRSVRLPLNFFMGIALAVAPWALVVALWRWWPPGERFPRRRRGIPNGTEEE